MDSAISNTVNASVALQQINVEQGAQAKLLRQALDTQASQISQLMESVPAEPQLATDGTLGTQINLFA